MRSTYRISFVLATALTIAACTGATVGADDRRGTTAGLPSCPSGTALFTVTPVAVADIGGWVPLGALNPPAHTFPTDHQYVYLATFTTPALQHPVPLVAPGNIVITRARRTTYSNDGHTDYALTFAACREVAGEFGHVATVPAPLLARFGAIDQRCESYSPNAGLNVSTCYSNNIAVPVTAGEAIGTVGGAPNPASLDVSLWDTRVTPITYANAARWIVSSDGFDQLHVVGASDYFAEPARSAINAKVGSFDGRTQRTAQPLGGTIAVDVPGTAQGNWFAPGQPTHPEVPHLAIVPDAVDPTQIDVSIGTSQPGIAAGFYSFTPASGGATNRHPAQIVADGTIACAELRFGGVLLFQLRDASTLRVEARRSASTCASQTPFAFGVSTFDYVR